MEDDDEFGDLYSDVLLPFASSSSTAPHPSSPRPSIDLNLNLQTDPQEDLIRMAPYPNSAVPCQSLGQTASTNHGESVIDDAFKSKQAQSAGEAMVLERAEEELAGNVLSDTNHGNKLSSVNDDVHGEGAVKEKDSMDMDVKFDIEENGDGVEVVGSEPIIPGLSSDAGRMDENGDRGQGDEWDSDSDSEDDLQIVLNDNNHMNMERAGMAADGDDDNNVDNDPNQAVEKQEWGENATQPADGERKDMGDSAKASGGVMVAPKIGYNNHAYHPFHSQFKVSVWSLMLLERQSITCIWGFLLPPSILYYKELECSCLGLSLYNYIASFVVEMKFDDFKIASIISFLRVSNR